MMITVVNKISERIGRGFAIPRGQILYGDGCLSRSVGTATIDSATLAVCFQKMGEHRAVNHVVYGIQPAVFLLGLLLILYLASVHAYNNVKL